jgi:UDP:flavonoid glycosyltransferase YjiC (YdhE family)
VNFDQRDNASRLDDLGVGYGIPVKRFSGTRARQSLAELLDSVPAERTSELSERIDPESARAQACEAIERTAARS